MSDGPETSTASEKVTASYVAGTPAAPTRDAPSDGRTLTITPNTLIHDRYRVVGLIGRGGMGAVYEAIDERLGNPVALKQRLVHGAELGRAFEREAKLLAKLDHPALPRVTDYFSDPADQFLVMEFVSGHNIANFLEWSRRDPRVSYRACELVLGWADQLIRVLQYLRRQEPTVVHRDIKPQNLKMRSNGQLVLLDFGLAKGGFPMGADPFSGSVPGGTRAYAPLEQLVGYGTDPRSDIYSLAATLHHLLAGSPPIDAFTRAAVVLNRQPDPYQRADELNPHVPSGLGRLLSRMLTLAVNERPNDLDSLLAEVQSLHADAIRAMAEEEPPRRAYLRVRGPAVFDLLTRLWARVRRGHKVKDPTSSVYGPFDIHTAPRDIGNSPALRLAQSIAPVLERAQVLWVDDRPETVRPFCSILNSLGITVDLVISTTEALARSANKRYHLIVSDIERYGVADEGLTFLRALQERGPHPKVVFFISDYDPSRGTPPGAFGITNSGEELLRLLLEVLERERH